MKNQEKQTVLLGMSGGVDSSVAALLLKKKGYKVIGIFLKNYSDTKNKITGECSWIEEREMAKKIASILQIPLLTLDYEKEYKKYVINKMFKDYAKGLTPNPDISCNTIIKFPALWKKAKDLKADYIATGHYVKVKNSKNGYELLQGKDKKKDQSYFLYELSQSDLSHSIFPLGNLTKEEVRKIAKKNHFPNWNKPGTKGICFVGKINMKDFLKRKINEKKGKILSPEGEKIGIHPGISFFTIGERIGSKDVFIENSYRNKTKSKLYVADKRKNNILVVAPEGNSILKKKEIKIKNLKIINKNEKIPFNFKARIRHLGNLLKGRIKKKNKNYHFILNKSEKGIAPGQSIVIYHKNRVIGGGEISS